MVKPYHMDAIVVMSCAVRAGHFTPLLLRLMLYWKRHSSALVEVCVRRRR